VRAGSSWENDTVGIVGIELRCEEDLQGCLGKHGRLKATLVDLVSVADQKDIR
jgi:hypothetical protein